MFSTLRGLPGGGARDARVRCGAVVGEKRLAWQSEDGAGKHEDRSNQEVSDADTEELSVPYTVVTSAA